MSDSLNPQFQNMSNLEGLPAQDNIYCEEFLVNDKKTYRCTFPSCGKIFKFKSEIMRHLPVHAEKKLIICPYEDCKKSFKRADALKNHMRIHTNQFPFKCDFSGCELKFSTQAGLRYHLLKHNDNKIYKCSFKGCTKTFLTLPQLKQHEKAINYHQRINETQTVTEESVKSPEQDQQNVDFLDKAPRETVHIVNKVMEKSPTNDNRVEKKEVDQKNFEGMVKFLLQESAERKNTIALCSKFLDTFQENYELKVQSNRQIISSNPDQNNLAMSFFQNESPSLDSYVDKK